MNSQTQSEYLWVSGSAKRRLRAIKDATRSTLLTDNTSEVQRIKNIQMYAVLVRNEIADLIRMLKQFYPLHLGTMDRIHNLQSKAGRIPKMRNTSRLIYVDEEWIKQTEINIRETVEDFDTVNKNLLQSNDVLASSISLSEKIVDELSMFNVVIKAMTDNYIQNLRYLEELERVVIKNRHNKR